MKNITEYELEPIYISRKSFYQKAKVRIEEHRTVLLSYNTEVAYIKNNKVVVLGKWSRTTTIHIKEFLRQKGFKAENIKQMLKDYGVKK